MHKDQLRGLIQETLLLIGLYSEDAAELLMGTAAVESKLGYYIKQVGGPARGIFQMEPDTEKDIWENFLFFKQGLQDKMYKLGYMHPNPELLVYDLRYQILMARLHYRRVPYALPTSTVGQARYWKVHYNTVAGKGTVEKYMDAYDYYVGGPNGF